MSWLAPRTDGISVPVPSPESGPYWEGTRAGELRFQRCRACGTANFGPGIGCRACRTCRLWSAQVTETVALALQSN